MKLKHRFGEFLCLELSLSFFFFLFKLKRGVSISFFSFSYARLEIAEIVFDVICCDYEQKHVYTHLMSLSERRRRRKKAEVVMVKPHDNESIFFLSFPINCHFFFLSSSRFESGKTKKKKNEQLCKRKKLSLSHSPSLFFVGIFTLVSKGI